MAQVEAGRLEQAAAIVEGSGEELRFAVAVNGIDRWPGGEYFYNDSLLVATDARLVLLKSVSSGTFRKTVTLQSEGEFSYSEMAGVGIDRNTGALSFTSDPQELFLLPLGGESDEWKGMVSFIASRLKPAPAPGPADAPKGDRTQTDWDSASLFELLTSAGLSPARRDDDHLRISIDGTTLFAWMFPERPFFVLNAVLGLKSGTSRSDAVELCNRINDNMIMARCCCPQDDGEPFIYFDHFTMAEGGLTGATILATTQRFARVVKEAVGSQDEGGIVA